MIIKDITNNYEKTINAAQIEHIDCTKREGEEWPFQYVVFTTTFFHLFKTKKRITEDMVFDAIETYSFPLDSIGSLPRLLGKK